MIPVHLVSVSPLWLIAGSLVTGLSLLLIRWDMKPMPIVVTDPCSLLEPYSWAWIVCGCGL
jgi:hypothetical protein